MDAPSRKLWLLLFALLVCVDPRAEVCKVACRFEGYDSGILKKEKCLCFDEYLYSDLVLKKYFRRGESDGYVAEEE